MKYIEGVMLERLKGKGIELALTRDCLEWLSIAIPQLQSNNQQ